MKQESHLATIVAGPVKSTVDYFIVQQEDKAKVRNVKVIPVQDDWTSLASAICTSLQT